MTYSMPSDVAAAVAATECPRRRPRAERTADGSTLSKLSVRSLRRSTPHIVRNWIAPMIVVIVLALLFSTSFYVLDLLFLTGHNVQGISGIVAYYLSFSPEHMTDALPALGMTIVAALGIVLTVIAIIVQLSSDRYTGVAMMFLRDPVHVFVLSYYIIASLCAVWLSVTLQTEFIPRSLLLVVMILTSIGLATMLPYFAYTFWFLEPGNILARLRLHTTQLNRLGLASESTEQIDCLQGRVVQQLEEITDIANNSIDGRDKIIAGDAVNALRDFLVDYIASKPQENRRWYRIGQELRDNPNFVAMDDELIEELEAHRLWVEWVTLHEYLNIYHDALKSMPDIGSLIAIDTRYIGEAAANSGRAELVRMVFRFMNSYLRSAIEDGNVRAPCNVLHQYRMLIEELLRLDQGDLACEGVGFLKYYGHLAFEEDLAFVTETVAYDIATLCQFAHEYRLAGEQRILRQLLDLDRECPTRGYHQQRGLRGVRKAQAKLAAYYISVGDEANARLIADDMRESPVELLRSIHDELNRVESAHFWEVVDRGRNFEYLPENERERLGTLFGWLAVAS